jgi:NADH-quinone oxidoreductase subunit K
MMQIQPSYYIALSLLLFFIGVLGIFLRKNLLVMFMCIELMLNSVNLALVAFSKFYQNLEGQLLVFFVITVAAAEATRLSYLYIEIVRHMTLINSRV